MDLSKPMDEIESAVAQIVLNRFNNNHQKAAESLGISRTTLWRILKDK